MKPAILIFAGAFLASGILFWLFYGRSLAWDVYAGGDVYWYSEEFSTRGKLIVTGAFSLIIASASVGLHALIRSLGKRKENED